MGKQVKDCWGKKGLGLLFSQSSHLFPSLPFSFPSLPSFSFPFVFNSHPFFFPFPSSPIDFLPFCYCSVSFFPLPFHNLNIRRHQLVLHSLLFTLILASTLAKMLKTALFNSPFSKKFPGRSPLYREIRGRKSRGKMGVWGRKSSLWELYTPLVWFVSIFCRFVSQSRN